MSYFDYVFFYSSISCQPFRLNIVLKIIAVQLQKPIIIFQSIKAYRTELNICKLQAQ